MPLCERSYELCILSVQAFAFFLVLFYAAFPRFIRFLKQYLRRSCRLNAEVVNAADIFDRVWNLRLRCNDICVRMRKKIEGFNTRYRVL